MDKLTAFMYERFASSILEWDENDVRDIYAISIYADFDFNEEGEFSILLSYNTVSKWLKHAESWKLDPAVARWEILCWPSTEQVSLSNIEDGLCTAEDAAIVNQLLDEQGLNPPLEEIGPALAREDYEQLPVWDHLCRRDFYLLDCCAEVARQLHDTGIILAKFGRCIPIIIHESDHVEGHAELTRKANPEGLVREFEDWIATVEDS